MRVRITDVTIRDGSHAIRHQWSLEQALAVAGAALDAGLPVVEVCHGDGLGGASLTYGFGLLDEHELIGAVAPLVRERGARLAVLLLPGIGLALELEQAAEEGASIVRVATHCTEADMAAQHLRKARELGMEAVGFLMMAHMASPRELADQARIQEAAGANVVYCTDTAGALIPSSAAERVAAMREALEPETTVGFHAHNNLGLAVANTLRAIEEGARHVDASLRGLGAGAGNCATEALAAACDKLGWETGVDVVAAANAAEDVVAPIPERQPIVDRSSLIMGWAGVGSSFLLHARRAAERFGVDEVDILLEAGRRQVVSGQDDLILEIALELAKRRGETHDLAGIRAITGRLS